jgi:hypothetical protein
MNVRISGLVSKISRDSRSKSIFCGRSKWVVVVVVFVVVVVVVVVVIFFVVVVVVVVFVIVVFIVVDNDYSFHLGKNIY